MKVSSNKLSDILNHYSSSLQNIYSEKEAKNLVFILFEHFFGVNRLYFSKNPSYRLSESEMLKVHFAVKELMQHKPIQYIIGEVDFAGIKITVESGVLIPRPETEELVELIKTEVKFKEENPSILDIGTGSGCIALALKYNFPQSEILAIDVSEKALIRAKKNAEKNNLMVNFLQLNILKDSNIINNERFDLIVSNPPYVRNSEKTLMKAKKTIGVK